MPLTNNLTAIKEIIRKAGDIVLNYYKSSDKIDYKEDLSPISLADKASHQYLANTLPLVLNVPVLSEEEIISYDIRKKWNKFWLIDPLDGTKEFISEANDFCINIALIENHKPILGVIYAPALDELYSAGINNHFAYEGFKHPANMMQANELSIAISRFHHSNMTQDFIEYNNIKHTTTIGAAIKFGRMALGQINLYPRFEGSKEWDTAAGQIIIEKAGFKLIDLTTKQSMLYNKKSIKNNYFIACPEQMDYTKLLNNGLTL